MDNNMTKTINNFYKYNAGTSSKQNEISDDNSFNLFITKIIGSMINNIQTAVSSKENSEIELDIVITRSDIERYIQTLSDITYYSKLDENLIELFKVTNLIVSNWLRLIKQANINNSIGFDEDSIKKSIRRIDIINDTLEGNLTLRELIDINRLLIKRAEQVLFNVPATFRPSNSFLEAMKDAISVNGSTDNR